MTKLGSIAIVVWLAGVATAAPKQVIPLPENLVEAAKLAGTSLFELGVDSRDVSGFVTLGAYDATSQLVHFTATPAPIHLATKQMLAPTGPVTLDAAKKPSWKAKALADLDLKLDPTKAALLAKDLADKKLVMRGRVALGAPFSAACDGCTGYVYEMIGWKLTMSDGTVVFSSNMAGVASPPTPPAPPPPTTGGCDEVSCVISNYADACCLKFRKKPGPMPPPRPTLPDALDRDAIQRGVMSVKASIMNCAKPGDSGVVKVSVKVNPNGLVASTVVKEAPNAPLGACVADKLEHAVFPKTQQGGSFSMPFVF